MHADAIFYEGVTLPGTFFYDNFGCAGALQAGGVVPKFQSGAGPVKRHLFIDWDSCKGRTATKEVTKHLMVKISLTLLAVSLLITQAAAVGDPSDDVKAIEIPTATSEELETALSSLKGDPQRMKIDTLMAVVENGRFSPAHRARVFVGIFEAYFSGSFPLRKLFQNKVVRGWLTDDTIEDATMASYVPVRRAPGLAVFRLQKSFDSTLKATIYFSLNRDLTKGDFLKEITQQPERTVVWVVDLAPSTISPAKKRVR